MNLTTTKHRGRCAVDQPKVDPKGETKQERTSKIDRINTDGREEGIRNTNMAGEIKASASALAGDFNFPPLTLWRARVLPLRLHYHWYLFVLIGAD
jgi:hypothetical protein